MFVHKPRNSVHEHPPETVRFYAGEFGYCFSNFSAFAVEWNGRAWPTSEHAYQAAKFDDPAIVEAIATAPSAHAALKLAEVHAASIRPSWPEEKRAVMKEICRAKLDQHEYVQRTLERSGNTPLVEDSPKDSYWGCGADGNGENHLGVIWMELREELRPEPAVSE